MAIDNYQIAIPSYRRSERLPNETLDTLRRLEVDLGKVIRFDGVSIKTTFFAIGKLKWK